jgi:DNA-binding transcriptional LysR family regulator
LRQRAAADEGDVGGELFDRQPRTAARGALFDRERTRKPTLTEAGMAVLSEAKTLSVGTDNLRAKVSGLIAGLKSEVALAVDVMMPTSHLVDAMQKKV